MTLPYVEPLVVREPAELQIPEPPRRREPGGPPCRICGGRTTEALWEDALPNVSDEEIRAAAERVAVAL